MHPDGHPFGEACPPDSRLGVASRTSVRTRHPSHTFGSLDAHWVKGILGLLTSYALNGLVIALVFILIMSPMHSAEPEISSVPLSRIYYRSNAYDPPRSDGLPPVLSNPDSVMLSPPANLPSTLGTAVSSAVTSKDEHRAEVAHSRQRAADRKESAMTDTSHAPNEKAAIKPSITTEIGVKHSRAHPTRSQPVEKPNGAEKREKGNVNAPKESQTPYASSAPNALTHDHGSPAPKPPNETGIVKPAPTNPGPGPVALTLVPPPTPVSHYSRSRSDELFEKGSKTAETDLAREIDELTGRTGAVLGERLRSRGRAESGS